ncbi:DUF1566 domain-containing protein [candidate division WS5 bacterium]|uniref:DUF1566 domain-containing protein n=1 Tax=candidate division WS5 bacterium TaxID=2093353 RepID=A0A419DAM3_9BACT|nr:MAG: DUF1566 domain-containing protein [candidate division WS5 bacterium]
MGIKACISTLLFIGFSNFPNTSEAVQNSVRILNDPPLYYSGIQSAYGASQYGDIIQSQETVYFEDIIFDDPINKYLTLEGGYDVNFTSITGTTVINGNVTITTGILEIAAGSLELADLAHIIPDTGQTQSYTETFGEDSDYTLNPLSYAANGDGTVTDNVTGLMWQQVSDTQMYNWYTASGAYNPIYNPESADLCASLSLGGYSDWRLPNEFELMGIVNYGIHYPSIDPIFANSVLNEYYWSSSSYVNNPYSAWSVGFGNGDVLYQFYKSYSGLRVRCVRGSSIVGVFNDNNDGTVTDEATGLVWQKDDDDTLRTWEAAIIYCEELTFPPSTYGDWRLPNIKELRSTVDNSAYKPAISASFPSTKPFYYWSSTSEHRAPSYVWRVDFYTGTHHSWSKLGDGYVRCVRGGL